MWVLQMLPELLFNVILKSKGSQGDVCHLAEYLYEGILQKMTANSITLCFFLQIHRRL